MTDKEKIRIAKNDLFRLANISKQIINAYEARDSLIMSLYGTGIDYSKDHVQTSPVNMMEEAFSRICDCEKRIDDLIDSRRVYLNKIYALQNDRRVNILIDKYYKLKSFRQIAEINNKSVSTVHEIHDDALIEYFNTNCC